jgi:phosphoribosylformimino-5-aminoimidazole carboxamide ribotide isomerase
MINVIPAIDLYNGNVVRLQKGDYNKETQYEQNPLEQAKIYQEAGFHHLHIVDLNGAKEGEFKNLNIIKEIIDETGLSIQSGGGIRTFQDCETLFEAGISKIVCSSMVVKNEPDWIKALETFGGEKCILGLDVKDGKMAYGGWLETSDEPIEEFINPMVDAGLKTVLSTDISRDGMLSGPNLEMYADLQKRFPQLNWIASGGVSNLEDLVELRNHNLYGVVVGKAYYEGNIRLDEMQELNRSV